MNAIKLLRIPHWIKNSFVLTGLLFAHAWHNHALIVAVLLIFIAFCFISSAVYIYNDIIDRTQDRLHPVKKYRPIAAQHISLPAAASIAALLFISAVSLSLFSSPKAAVMILAYSVLNIAYTHWLKHMIILDVFAISAGFMLRILAGTWAVNIPPSPWLLFCGIMITLFLGFTKRHAEIIAVTGKPIRKVLSAYNPVLLNKLISITASCSIMGYGLYTLSPETIRVHHTPYLIYTLPLVIYGIFRYLYLYTEDATKVLLTDKPLMITLLLWLLVTLYVIS